MRLASRVVANAVRKLACGLASRVPRGRDCPRTTYFRRSQPTSLPYVVLEGRSHPCPLVTAPCDRLARDRVRLARDRGRLAHSETLVSQGRPGNVPAAIGLPRWRTREDQRRRPSQRLGERVSRRRSDPTCGTFRGPRVEVIGTRDPNTPPRLGRCRGNGTSTATRPNPPAKPPPQSALPRFGGGGASGKRHGDGTQMAANGLLQQLQDEVRCLIRLSEHRDSGLLQDL